MMNIFRVDAWMAFVWRAAPRTALATAIALFGGVGAFAAPSRAPMAVAAGRPPVALQPPDHTPMPSARRPVLAPAGKVAVPPPYGGGAGHPRAAGVDEGVLAAKDGGPLHPLPSEGPDRLIRPRRGVEQKIEAESPGAAGWWLNTMWALAVVVVIIVALRFVLQRLGRGPGGRAHTAAMEVVGRVATGPRSAVLALRVGHRIVLVGQTANGLVRLADLTDPNEVATVLAATDAQRPGSVSRGFAAIFNQANRSYDQVVHDPNDAGDVAEFDIDHARDEVGGLLSRVRRMAGGAS